MSLSTEIRAEPTGSARRRSCVLLLTMLASLVLALPSAGLAQTAEPAAAADTVYEVRLADGSTFYGRVVGTNEERITFETAGGTQLEVSRAQLRSMEPARGRFVEGRFWREDPNQTRLFFAPTGRSLQAGEGYFGVYELFIPFLSYGITDRITLSGGSPFYVGMFDVTPPFYLAPKVQVLSQGQAQVSLGALAIFLPGSWDWDSDRTRSLGVAYGVGTFGDLDNAATAGIGWGFADGEFSPRPVVMFGGEVRTGRPTKLITENWFVPGEDGTVLSGGVRFFGERLSADAGLIGFVGSGESGCCLPLVNFVYHFGGQR